MKIMSITDLQRSTKTLQENNITCVLKNNAPAFFVVSPEVYEKTVNNEFFNKNYPLFDMFKNLAGCMQVREVESFSDQEKISKETFKEMVFALGFAYAEMESIEEIIRSLEV